MSEGARGPRPCQGRKAGQVASKKRQKAPNRVEHPKQRSREGGRGVVRAHSEPGITGRAPEAMQRSSGCYLCSRWGALYLRAASSGGCWLWGQEVSQEVGMGEVGRWSCRGRGQREAMNGSVSSAHTVIHLPCTLCWFSQLDLDSLRTPGPVLWPKQPSSGHLCSHSGPSPHLPHDLIPTNCVQT